MEIAANPIVFMNKLEEAKASIDEEKELLRRNNGGRLSKSIEDERNSEDEEVSGSMR